MQPAMAGDTGMEVRKFREKRVEVLESGVEVEVEPLEGCVTHRDETKEHSMYGLLPNHGRYSRYFTRSFVV